MPKVFDVAKYILHKSGRLTTWKLQKLCYYSQAWSLVWDEEPLFNERIEAWLNGPVIPALYQRHKGRFYVSRENISGDPSKLTTQQKETTDVVLESYGKKSSSWLSELTRSEPPWQNARQCANLGCTERGDAEITLGEIADYYNGIYAQYQERVRVGGDGERQRPVR